MPKADMMSVEQFWKQVDPEFLKRPELDDRVEMMLAALDQLVMDLNTQWMLYKQLFGEPTSVDLLLRNGSLVFTHLRRLLADSILLGIARLADRKGNSRKENLGACSLFWHLSKTEGLSEEVARTLETQRDRFLQKIEQIQRHRHKRIAHNDVGLLLRESEARLVDIEVEDVDQALQSLQDFARTVHEYFHMRFVDYDVAHEMGTDGVWLLKRLRKLDELEGNPAAEPSE